MDAILDIDQPLESKLGKEPLDLGVQRSFKFAGNTIWLKIVLYLCLYSAVFTFVTLLSYYSFSITGIQPEVKISVRAFDYLSVLRYVLPGLIVTISIAGFHIFLIIRRLIISLQQITFRLAEISKGELSQELKLHHVSYLQEFQDIFNNMLGSIDRRLRDINHSHGEASFKLMNLVKDVKKNRISSEDVVERLKLICDENDEVEYNLNFFRFGGGKGLGKFEYEFEGDGEFDISANN